jgi:MOSC domain-containing protein YiiM
MLPNLVGKANIHRSFRGVHLSLTAPVVIGVFASHSHNFSKEPRPYVVLLAGRGVEGDAHCGTTVQHRWDAMKRPWGSNFRQVHLLQAELLGEVNANGFDVQPGNLGENVSTRGINLLALPTGTQLHLGSETIVRITGLRKPCAQINKFRKGLLEEVVERRVGAPLISKTGVMSVVIRGGHVRPDDGITVHLPDGPHIVLKPV